LILSIACLGPSVDLHAAPSHPLADIRETAMAYARANIDTRGGEIHLSVEKLDTRLRLAKCEQPLSARLPYPGGRSASMIVAVQCDGGQPWSLHVPVKVRIYRQVAVASRPLARGVPVGEADVALQRMDISRLAGGYVTDRAAIIGQVTTRPVQMGRPLLSGFLQPATIIRRGQRITLLARYGGIEVRSAGESLMDGAVGERIRVRNRRTRRVVEGTVADDGAVLVR